VTSKPAKTASVLAVASVFLTVCLVGSGAAFGAPAPSAAASATEWAYGAVRTVQFSGVDTSAHTYQGSATYGFSVILNETANTSSGGVTNTTVHLNRTIGALISVEYCLGRCSSGTELANYSFHEWEVANAWANVTTGGTVAVAGGGSVAALALSNSSESDRAYLRESIQLGHGAVPARYDSLFVNVTGSAEVALSPSLGLFPLNLSALAPGATWSSSSAYNATGAVVWSAWLSNWGSSVVHPGNFSSGATDALAGTGTVSLTGTYPAGSIFSYDHTAFPALNLTIAGPFTLREGVLLVPADADLFASGSQPWSGNESGSSIVTSSFVDVHPGASYQGHLPIVASSASWVSVTTDAAATLVPSAPGTPLAPSSVPASASNATVVQGQPESIAQAGSNQACLVSGVGCPTLGPHLPWLRYAIVGGGIAVVAAVVAVALVTRRKLPPPAYPNAQLYPPGGAAGAPPVRPAPKPAEDDPLGHLW